MSVPANKCNEAEGKEIVMENETSGNFILWGHKKVHL